jgi:hypothetical protein
VATAAAAVMAFAGVGAGAASAHMIKLPNLLREAAVQRRAAANQPGIYPKAPPCPENGLLSGLTSGITIAGTGIPVANCGISEAPATTLPFLGDMAYWGGKVQVHPKEFLVYWGWGQPGAFPKRTCTAETVTEGSLSTALACDPDGAGKYMADFVAQMGATNWAEVQDQYFQTGSTGKPTYIDETGKHLLAGLWSDDSVPSNFEKTLGSNPAGPTNTYTDFALEATRAVAHFEATGQLRPADLADANFIIAQPPGYTDPNALAQGYCAFHDYTLAAAPGNAYYKYPGIRQGISYTNMPYTLAIDIGGSNVCGADAVNPPPRGNLDTFSLALGHEIQETATDPGAEDIVGNLTTGAETYYGGWYDIADANENGDKCAYVGTPVNGALGLNDPTGLEPREFPIPGAMGNLTGNAGEKFAVQSLWSNASAGGAGYCAGVPSTDLPGGLAGEPPYGPETLLGLSKRAIASGQAAKKARKHAASKRHHATRKRHHAGKRHRATKRHRTAKRTSKRG